MPLLPDKSCICFCLFPGISHLSYMLLMVLLEFVARRSGPLLCYNISQYKALTMNLRSIWEPERCRFSKNKVHTFLFTNFPQKVPRLSAEYDTTYWRWSFLMAAMVTHKFCMFHTSNTLHSDGLGRLQTAVENQLLQSSFHCQFYWITGWTYIHYCTLKVLRWWR